MTKYRIVEETLKSGRVNFHIESCDWWFWIGKWKRYEYSFKTEDEARRMVDKFIGRQVSFKKTINIK